MDYKTVAEVATIALAGSELLSLVPNVKANSWVQLGLNVLEIVAASGKQKPHRRR